MLELVIISTLNGVLYGMLLFLMASGLTLIFSMMGVLNFAHASFYMLGAFFGFQISQWLGFWPAFVVAPVLVGAIWALVERYGLRNVHRHGHVAELLFAIAIFAVLLAVLTKTRVGLIIQAALTHPNMVAMLGHNVPRVFMLVFGVGTGLAAVAGVIAGPAFVTQSNMAAVLGPILFVVIVVGGMGSLSGAFVASLLIGLVQTFAVSVNYSASDLFAGIGFSPASGTILHDLWEVTLAQIAPIIL